MFTALRRSARRAVLAYHLRCAREDARIRGLAAPIGVWVCDYCRQVALSVPAMRHHLAAAHAPAR